MKRLLMLLPLVALTGCAIIDADCPTDGSTLEAAVGGSTVGTTAIGMAAAAGKAAGVMAPKPGEVAPSPGACHVHYTYSPIFGSDYVRVGKLPPAITVVTSPPASIVQ